MTPITGTDTVGMLTGESADSIIRQLNELKAIDACWHLVAAPIETAPFKWSAWVERSLLR